MEVQIKKVVTIFLDEAELKALQNILDETDEEEIFLDSGPLYNQLKAIISKCLRKD